MAGFLTDSINKAEAVLADFPRNWTREAHSAGPNSRTFYRCKSDPSVIAVVERISARYWFTGVDVDTSRDGDASREARQG